MSSGLPSAAPSEDGSDAPSATFRLSRMAYGIVLLLFFCVVPFAFTAGAGSLKANTTSDAALSWRVVFVLIPILAAFFIARTATVVDASGVRVRALFGQRTLPWEQIQGLSVSDRAVYAVIADGAVRLPCVRVSDLAALSRVSGGHVPDLPYARIKAAPSKRKR